MPNLIDRLKIAYLTHKYKSPPDLYDKRGLPYWLYKKECLEERYSDWFYSGGGIRDRVFVVQVELSWEENSTEILLENIFIKESIRGLGIGSQMIALVKEFANMIGKQIIIGHISENDSPIETGLFDWYSHHGFEIIHHDHDKNSEFVADIRCVL